MNWVLLLLSIFSFQHGHATTEAFPYKQGWLGADAAYSIELPLSHKRLWFFGDTFLAKTNDDGFKSRSFSPGRFIFNSIGISEGFNLDSMKYYWKTSRGSHGFFQTESTGAKTKFWPKAAFVHNNILYVTLLLVEFAHSEAEFKPIATYLAQISNPYDSPNDWNIQYIRLMDSSRIFPGSAVVNWGPYILMFSTLTDTKGSNHQLVLLRIKLPPPNFSSLSIKAEYLSKNDTWRPLDNIMIDDAKILFEPASTEMSLLFHPGSGSWITVYSANAFLDKTVKIRTAPTPLGPWSEAQTLFEFKEFSQNIAGLFCYAAKGYTFDKNILTLSYTCNSMDIEQLLDNKNIYTPKLMRVDLTPYLFLK